MKKSIEKLFKNEIFKRVTMSIMFVLMCSFACFLNWKAIVGAEGEGGAGTRAASSFTLLFNEDAYFDKVQSNGTLIKVSKIECDMGDDAQKQTLYDSSVSSQAGNITCQVPFDTTKPLSVYIHTDASNYIQEESGNMVLLYQNYHLAYGELFDMESTSRSYTTDQGTPMRLVTYKMSAENAAKFLRNDGTYRIVPSYNLTTVEGVVSMGTEDIGKPEFNLHGDPVPYQRMDGKPLVYDYLNVKYETKDKDASENYIYRDWYGDLCFIKDELSLKVKIEGKDGVDTSCLEYANINVSDQSYSEPLDIHPYVKSWNADDNPYLAGGTSTGDNLTSGGAYFFFLRGFADVLKIKDNDEENLYNKLEVEYKNGDVPGYDSGFIAFPTSGEGENKSYAPLRTGQENTKITLAVKPKPGYDISNMRYFLDHLYSYDAEHHTYTVTQDPNVDSNWKRGSVDTNGYTIVKLEVGENPTVMFKDFSYTSVDLYFRDANGEELGTNILAISPGGDTTIKEYRVDGISTTTFMVTLGNDCMSTALSISNFSLAEPVQSGNVSLSGVWNDQTKKFELTVETRTFDPSVEIQIINISAKEALFTFKMEDGFEYPLSVGTSAVVTDSSHKELNSFPQTVDNARAFVGSNFVFYLKTADYAHWSNDYVGEERNPESNKSIFGLMTFENGTIASVTSEHLSTDLYKITLKDVHCYGDDTTIPITFKKDASDVYNISISFTEINLPVEVNDNVEEHKKIKVTQNTTEYEYLERGSARYMLVAKLKPTRNNILKDTKIELLNTNGNFEFKGNTLSFGSTEFAGTVYANKMTCSFNLKGVSGAFSALKSGDLNIKCLCLKPNDKTLNVVSDGFDKDSIVVKDGKNNSYAVNEGVCKFPYGSTLSISATVSDGYEINALEEQFHAYIVAADGSRINMTEWEIKKEGDSTCVVTFGKPLTENMVVEFIGDSNNLPIAFKNSEGIEYYYANMGVNPDGINELITDNPLVKENGQNKLLRGIEKVNSGNSYYFAVGVKPGYDINNLTIKSNGKIMEAYRPDGYEDYMVESCKFYKLENVEASITISGVVDKSTVMVTFNDTSRDGEETRIKYNSDNAEVKSLNATYGNSVTFTVSFENQDKYGQSDFKVHVKNKNDPYPNEADKDKNVLTKYQNEYKILDLTEDKEVYVTGVTINKYVVNFVSSNRAGFLIDSNSFQGTREVTHGSNIEFRIKAKEGYQLGKETVVNCQSASGDSEISKDKGSSDKYTLSDIRENCTVTIDNVGNIVYRVNFKDVPGATYLNDKGSVVSGGMRVKYGGNVEFSVNVDDAYDDSAAGMFVVLNNGKSKLHAQKLASGRYMISNITEDLNIRVGNIRKNTYTVTLRNEEGIDYYNSNDKIINGDNTVNHGDSFSFRVSLYPAYSDSKIAVMLGTDELSADSNGYYTIPGVVEDKIITVTGIHPNTEVSLINTINNLPSSINDLNDVNPVIEASRWYNSLSDEQRARVTNADVLMNLQQQAGALLHNSDGITVDGADWYIKLVVIPISSDMDACTRIYKKLTSEYILSLYDIYLWDTLNDVKYTSYGDQVYTVTIPAPKLTNFRNPTGVHEDSNSGKISFMDLLFNGDKVSFETNSFSAMGVVASHDASGISSLLDTPGANIPWIRDYVFGGARSGGPGNGSSGNTLINGDDGSAGDDIQDTGNISDKFKSMNNRVTPQGSALRLILVLLILILLALALWLIYKKRKEKKE